MLGLIEAHMWRVCANILQIKKKKSVADCCVTSAGPYHMQQLATCSKLNHIYGYQPVGLKNRNVQQWAEFNNTHTSVACLGRARSNV